MLWPSAPVGANACGQSVSPAGGRPSLQRGGILGSFLRPRGRQLCVGGAGVSSRHISCRVKAPGCQTPPAEQDVQGVRGLSAPALLLFSSLNLGKPPGQKRAVFSSSSPWTWSPCSHELPVGGDGTASVDHRSSASLARVSEHGQEGTRSS